MVVVVIVVWADVDYVSFLTLPPPKWAVKIVHLLESPWKKKQLQQMFKVLNAAPFQYK